MVLSRAGQGFKRASVRISRAAFTFLTTSLTVLASAVPTLLTDVIIAFFTIMFTGYNSLSITLGYRAASPDIYGTSSRSSLSLT